MKSTNEQTETNESFDCLKFKESAQAEIVEETRNMNQQELLDFFHKASRSGALG
jgi:hypothetical protein